MQELKSAVIGAGFVGRAHVEALRRLNIPVVGVLGSSPERGEEVRRQLGLARAYRSLEELTADPAPDVVHICTPNHLHFSEASALLRAGKHVMCEKPLAMTVGESAELIQLAKSEQRVGGRDLQPALLPAMPGSQSDDRAGRNWRAAPGSRRLSAGDWLLYPTDWNWRLERELGGDLRAVADIGTHWLDLVTWLTGRKVTAVCGELATVLPMRKRPRGRVETFQAVTTQATDEVAIDTDDYASVLLRFENNVRGVMTVSQVSAGHKAQLSFEINGSEGTLAWNSESSNQLWIGRRNEASRLLPKDPALMSAKARGYAAYPGGHQEGYPDTFVQLFRDFYRYIQAGDFSAPRAFPTFETGHEELVLSEAILQSARDGRWVASRQEL